LNFPTKRALGLFFNFACLFLKNNLATLTNSHLTKLQVSCNEVKGTVYHKNVMHSKSKQLHFNMV